MHVAAPELPAESAIYKELAALGVVVHNVPMRRTGLNPVADLGTALFLWQQIRRLRPEVILASAVKPVVYGMLAAALAAVPRRFALIRVWATCFKAVSEEILALGCSKPLCVGSP